MKKDQHCIEMLASILVLQDDLNKHSCQFSYFGLQECKSAKRIASLEMELNCRVGSGGRDRTLGQNMDVHKNHQHKVGEKQCMERDERKK